MPALRTLCLLFAIAPSVAVRTQEPRRAPAPILAGSAEHGLPGKAAGSERWLVTFAARSFDLAPFRAAIAGKRPAAEIAVIVRGLEQRARNDHAPFVAAVQQLGGTVVQQWWLIDAAAVEIDPVQLDALRRLPNVAFVHPDESCAPAIQTSTNASNHAADGLQAAGHRGQGVAVGVVDTGQDENVNGIGRPHRVYFVNGDPLNLTGGGIGGSRLLVNRQIGLAPADDSLGHGTGVASICAGANWGTSGADDGHAPAAGITGYSIANNTGNGASDFTTMASAWQQLAADRALYNVVAANMSYHASPDPLNVSSQAIDSAALNADVMCCVAAGNTGSSTMTSCSGANGLAVAAVATNSHVVASFSSRGPMAGDPQRFYPDIAACGVSTVMAEHDNEAVDYVSSGTSMAAPQVAGAAAQLRARFPALTALETKAVLLAACRDVSTQNPGLDRNSYGMGLLRNDVAHALAAGGQTGTAIVGPGALQHTFTVPVQAGLSYCVAVTWHRQDVTTFAWSNLDVAVLDAGATVLGASATPRNLYEVVRFFAPATGNVTVRTTAQSLSPAQPQTFAWAWTVGSPVTVAGIASPYGSGCAPLCSSLNGGGGTLAPQTRPSEVAYAMPSSPGMQLLGFDVLTSATTTSPTTVTAAVYADAGGTPAQFLLAATAVTTTSVPGFCRATFASPVNLPAGPFWIGIDHRQQTTNLSNLTAGATATCRERPAFASGAWSASPLTLRPSFRLYCALPGSGGLPRLAVTAVPTIGTTTSFDLSHAPGNGVAWLALGLSNTSSPFGPLPLALGGLGAPECSVLTSSDVLDARITDAAGSATSPFAIPFSPALVSMHLYAQYAAWAPAANALGLTFSNGTDVRIGN